MFYKNAFCNGIGCHKQDRKNVCIDCKKEVCSTCTIKESNKTYCINCFILSFPKALMNELSNKDDNVFKTPIKKRKSSKKKHEDDDLNKDWIIDDEYFTQKDKGVIL